MGQAFATLGILDRFVDPDIARGVLRKELEEKYKGWDTEAVIEALHKFRQHRFLDARVGWLEFFTVLEGTRFVSELRKTRETRADWHPASIGFSMVRENGSRPEDDQSAMEKKDTESARGDDDLATSIPDDFQGDIDIVELDGESDDERARAKKAKLEEVDSDEEGEEVKDEDEKDSEAKMGVTGQESMPATEVGEEKAQEVEEKTADGETGSRSARSKRRSSTRKSIASRSSHKSAASKATAAQSLRRSSASQGAAAQATVSSVESLPPQYDVECLSPVFFGYTTNRTADEEREQVTELLKDREAVAKSEWEAQKAREDEILKKLETIDRRIAAREKERKRVLLHRAKLRDGR